MSTTLAKVYREYASTEAALTLAAGQWGQAQDTGRIKAMRRDGVTFDWIETASRLAGQTSVTGAALIGSAGITGITPNGGSSGAAATLANMLIGIRDSVALKSPYNSTINTIQPTADYIPLTIKGFSGQTNNLLSLETSSAAVAWFDNKANLTLSRSDAGNPTSISIINSNNSNTASSALLTLGVGGSSAGDPYIRINTNGVQDWSMGSDTSAGQNFVIANSSTLGAGRDWLSITPAGAITLNGAVSVSSNMTITGYVKSPQIRVTNSGAYAIETVGGSAQSLIVTDTSMNISFGAGINSVTFYSNTGAVTAGAYTSAGAWTLGPSASTNTNLTVNGAVSITTALTAQTATISGLITANGKIDVSLADPSINGVRIIATTTTNGAAMTFNSNSANSYVGRDNSVGNNIQSTSFLPYALCVWNADDREILFGTNNVLRMKIDSSAVAITDALTVSGVQSNSQAIAFVANGTTGAGRILKTASDGLLLRGVTGSSNDFGIYSNAGTLILSNPTGTSNLTIPGGDLTISRSTAGLQNLFSVINGDNTDNNSRAKVFVGVGGSSAGDPSISFNVASVTTWSIGIDNNVSGDPLKVSASSTIGTSDALTIDSALLATFGGSVVCGGGNGTYFRPPTGTSNPSSPAQGWMYENTGDGHLYRYTGSAWVAIA